GGRIFGIPKNHDDLGFRIVLVQRRRDRLLDRRAAPADQPVGPHLLHRQVVDLPDIVMRMAAADEHHALAARCPVLLRPEPRDLPALRVDKAVLAGHLLNIRAHRQMLPPRHHPRLPPARCVAAAAHGGDASRAAPRCGASWAATTPPARSRRPSTPARAAGCGRATRNTWPAQRAPSRPAGGRPATPTAARPPRGAPPA